ncbi:hypothetical protein L9F63_023680, partial [Diploptera punctata]
YERAIFTHTKVSFHPSTFILITNNYLVIRCEFNFHNFFCQFQWFLNINDHMCITGIPLLM